MPNALHGCNYKVVVVLISEQAGEAVLNVDALGTLIRPRRHRGHLLALHASSAPPLAAVARRQRRAQDEVGVLVQLWRGAKATREVAAARVGVEAAAPGVVAAVGDRRRAEGAGAEAA